MTMWLEELTIMENEHYIDWRNESDVSDQMAPKNLDIDENMYKLDLEYIKKKPA